MDHAYCKNNECLKKDECKRYLEQGVAEIEFVWICREDNDFKWFWPMEKALETIRQEDN